jgi:hypothetical protein
MENIVGSMQQDGTPGAAALQGGEKTRKKTRHEAWFFFDTE